MSLQEVRTEFPSSIELSNDSNAVRCRMSAPSTATLRRECTAISRNLSMTPAEFADWLGMNYLVRSVDDLGFVAAGKCHAQLAAIFDERYAAECERVQQEDSVLDRPHVFGGRATS